MTHLCTKFVGPFPVRIIIWFHQRYVIWACEKYINETDFGIEDADLDKQHAIIANIPKHTVKEFISKLTTEKSKKVEAMRNDRSAEYDKLAKEEAELKALKQWMYNPSSDMKLVKKKGAAKPGKVGAKDSDVQLKVGNKEAQDAIAVAMKDSKDNKAIGSALKELQDSVKADEPLWKQQAQKLGRV